MVRGQAEIAALPIDEEVAALDEARALYATCQSVCLSV
jgi:hypothetical protein